MPAPERAALARDDEPSNVEGEGDGADLLIRREPRPARLPQPEARAASGDLRAVRRQRRRGELRRGADEEGALAPHERAAGDEGCDGDAPPTERPRPLTRA